MTEIKKPVVVEEKEQDEDKSEVLGNLVKVVVLIWSACNPPSDMLFRFALPPGLDQGGSQTGLFTFVGKQYYS